MHEVDYKIYGDDMQYVEVELDPMEAAVAEAGGMMYMDDGIEMETIFGDGSQQSGGFLNALVGAGKRLLTGESLFMTVFQNQGAGKKRVAFGAPYPGKIIPVHLAEIGGELIAQKDAFLCAAKGVSVGIAFNKKIGVGLFGGEGFIMERLQGDGWAFLHAGGTIYQRDLGPGEVLRVDTGCIVAFQPHASWRSNPMLISTFSSSARSNPHCSGAKVCSSPPCAGRDVSGSNRFRSAAWPTVLSPRRPGLVGAGAKKVPSSADWAAWWVATTPDSISRSN